MSNPIIDITDHPTENWRDIKNGTYLSHSHDTIFANTPTINRNNKNWVSRLASPFAVAVQIQRNLEMNALFSKAKNTLIASN